MRIIGYRVSRLFVGFLPSNFLRVLGYRLLPRTRIGRNVRIGWGCILDAKRIEIGDDVQLGYLVFAKNVDEFRIGRAVRMGSHARYFDAKFVDIGEETIMAAGNCVQGARWLADLRSATEVGGFKVGKRCNFGGYHFFDVTAGVTLGDGVSVGGRNCSFFTHGGGPLRRKPIVIGNGCYLGTNSKFAPGVTLADNILVSIGSVLVKSIDEPDCIVGGVPAKIVKRDPHWKERGQLPASDAESDEPPAGADAE